MIILKYILLYIYIRIYTLLSTIFTPIDINNPVLSNETTIKATALQEYFLPPININYNNILKAIPTNTWWAPLIEKNLNFDNSISNDNSYPIFSNPYKLVVQTTSFPYGIHITYPPLYRSFGPVDSNNASSYYIHASGVSDIVFTSTEIENNVPNFNVLDWDDLSVKIIIYNDNNINQNITSTFVSGMAFVTTIYNNLTPKLDTQHAILSVNNQSPTSLITQTQKIVIELNNGQTWILYSSDPVDWKITMKSITCTSNQYKNLILRVALLPSNANSPNLYDPYASCIVDGCTVDANNSVNYRFIWSTSGYCGLNGLLHFALSHHIDSLNLKLSKTSIANNIILASATHGKMQAYATLSNTWYFNETDEINIGFYSPRSPNPQNLIKYNVIEQLVTDIKTSWELISDGGYYTNGKLMQKYSVLCLLSAEPTIMSLSSYTSDNNPLLNICLTQLTSQWNTILDNELSYRLVYDIVYRGIVTNQVFALNNSNDDFGNSVYNDHHYHYGYWLVSGAILHYLYPKWKRTNELIYFLKLLIRDVSNPSTLDKYFPRFRNFNWYTGLSYSHGILPMGDGKDEESTSEEMNYHYGLMLLGKALNDTNLEQLGKLMLKLNKRGINNYVFMKDNSTVQPEQMIPNKVAGILFDNKVDYTTWFGNNKEYIHGIQMIPVSPINEYFRTYEFVKEEWDEILSKIPIILGTAPQSAWQSLLYANIANVYNTEAINQLLNVPLDDGLSRSWALYYALTRPNSS